MLATVLGIQGQEAQMIKQFNSFAAKATHAKHWSITDFESKAVFVDPEHGVVYKVYMTPAAKRVITLIDIFEKAGVTFFNPVETIYEGELLTITKEAMVTLIENKGEDNTEMDVESFAHLLPPEDREKTLDFLSAFFINGTTPNNMGRDSAGNLRCFDWGQANIHFTKVKQVYQKYGLELPDIEQLLTLRLYS